MAGSLLPGTVRPPAIAIVGLSARNTEPRERPYPRGFVIKGSPGLAFAVVTSVTLAVRGMEEAQVNVVAFDNASKLLTLGKPRRWFASGTHGEALRCSRSGSRSGVRHGVSSRPDSRGEFTQLEADGGGIRGVVGRLLRWRQGGRIRETDAAIGAVRTWLRRRRAELEARQLGERVQLGRRDARQIRAIEEKIGEAYQRHIKGLEERAGRAAQTRGWGGGMQYDSPRRLRVLPDEARLEQDREVEGEEEGGRRIEKLRELGERVRTTRPTHQRPPRGPERGGGIEKCGPCPRLSPFLWASRWSVRFP